MLLVSNYMLNHVFEAYSVGLARFSEVQIPIYPWTDNTNNLFATGDNNRCIRIPDIVPCQCVKEGADFSMCAGEFLDSYGDQENEWDCVLTSFFIDTAPVVFEYVEIIHRILKPGGYWINLGPLLYHWQVGERGGVERSLQTTCRRRRWMSDTCSRSSCRSRRFRE